MDLVFFDFAVLVILPDLFIREELAPLDFIERGPFLFRTGFLDWLVLIADLIDLEATDFFPRVLSAENSSFFFLYFLLIFILAELNIDQIIRS